MNYKFVKQPLRGLRIITAEQLEKIETEYGITFPPVLREYYLQLNGCEIKECSFMIAGYEFIVDLIIAVHTGKFELESMLKQDRDNAFIPESMIPLAVAITEGGTYYLDKTTEDIWLTHQESEEDFQYVCTGVSEFISLLNKACSNQSD